MTWPTTWGSLRVYRNKAPCGCRYAVMVDEEQRIVYVEASPNRMQRCFAHMREDGRKLATLIFEPLKGIFDA